MPGIRTLLRGLPQIGDSIDKRLRHFLKRKDKLELRHAGGLEAPLAPMSGLAGGGSSGGGGSESDTPAYPESFSPSDASYLVLDASGALSAERVLAAGDGPHLEDAGPEDAATLAVDESVLRTTGDQEVEGVKTFVDPPGIEEFISFSLGIESPEMPDAGKIQLYGAPTPGGLDGSRLYALDDTGAVHDLCVQQREVHFPAMGDIGAGTADVRLPWAAAAFGPSGAIVSQAPVSVASLGVDGGFAFPGLGSNAPASSGDLFGRWQWTSSYSPGPPFAVWSNAQVGIGMALGCLGGSASLQARLRLNLASRFSGLFISFCDALDSSNAHMAGVLSLLSDDTWTEVAINDVDISSWSSSLRVLITAQGTLDPADVGLTQLDIEWILVEQWAR